MNRKSTMAATLAAAAALSLSACQTGTQASGSGSSSTTSSGGAKSSTSSSTHSSSGSSGSTTSSASTSTQGSSESGTPVPDSQRQDSGDSSALKASIGSIPSGPMTGLKVIRLGGYRTSPGGQYGDFYAVLKVDGKAGGLVDLEYVLLDDNNKELGRVEDSIRVGKGTDMLKVTRAAGKAPAATKKVMLVVKSNKENQFAQDLQIKPQLKITTDPDTRTPVVSGEYKTVGDATVTSINAVCFDASGKPAADTSAVPEIKAPTWTPFQVKVLSAPTDYKPTQCYVGQ